MARDVKGLNTDLIELIGGFCHFKLMAVFLNYFSFFVRFRKNRAIMNKLSTALTQSQNLVSIGDCI
jgi:hypothetical protein